MEQDTRLIPKSMRNSRRLSTFDFVEVVRNLDKISGSVAATGFADDLSDEKVRFSQKTTLSGTDPDVTAITEDGRGNVLVEVSRPGLWGPDGPMPLDQTNFVLQRSKNYYDYGTQRFTDIIHNRFLALYYRAFAQRDFAICFDEKTRNVPQYLLKALSGDVINRAFALPLFASEAMFPYTLTRSGSAEGLQRILRSFFDLEIKVKSKIFGRYMIPQSMHCLLGKKNVSRLGESMQIGNHYYSHSRAFNLIVGPVTFAECQTMLPGTRDFSFLIQIINFYLQKPLNFDLIFILRKDSLKGVFLNGRYALGRSSFFKYKDDNGMCTISISASRLGSNIKM